MFWRSGLTKKIVALSILSVMSLAVGCGKTDPADNYSGLKSQTAPGERKIVSLDGQTYAPGLSIAVGGKDQTNNGNFFEGVQGSVPIVVKGIPGVAVRLEAVSDLKGGNISATANPNVWSFVWTPPQGTVPGDLPSTSVSFTFIALPQSNDPAYARLGHPQPLQFVVNKKIENPTIEGISGFKTTLNEGEFFKFTVSVTDRGNPNNPPKLTADIYDSENKENHKLSGFIQSDPKDAVESRGNGSWIIHRVFTLQGVSLEKMGVGSGKNSVLICANFTAISLTSRGSTEPFVKCVKSYKAVQGAEINFPNAPYTEAPIEMTAGKTNTYDFTVSIPNGNGAIELKTSTLEKIPGSPTITPKDGNTSDAARTFTLTWNAPCSLYNQKPVTINFTASNTRAAVKANTMSRSFKFSSLDPTCGAPNPQKAAVASPKQDAKPTAQSQPAKPQGPIIRNARAGAKPLPEAQKKAVADQLRKQYSDMATSSKANQKPTKVPESSKKTVAKIPESTKKSVAKLPEPSKKIAIPEPIQKPAEVNPDKDGGQS